MQLVTRWNSSATPTACYRCPERNFQTEQCQTTYCTFNYRLPAKSEHFCDSMAVKTPDLNPIEHVWDELDQCERQRQAQPQSLQALQQALKYVWQKISQVKIHRLIESKSRCVLQVYGSHNRCWYWRCVNGRLKSCVPFFSITISKNILTITVPNFILICYIFQC